MTTPARLSSERLKDLRAYVMRAADVFGKRTVDITVREALSLLDEAESRAPEAARAQTCATCKWFDPDPDSPLHLGLCERGVTRSSYGAVAPSFGCTLHEPLPAPPDGGRDQ